VFRWFLESEVLVSESTLTKVTRHVRKIDSAGNITDYLTPVEGYEDSRGRFCYPVARRDGSTEYALCQAGVYLSRGRTLEEVQRYGWYP
jgi:hypothetical protein